MITFLAFIINVGIFVKAKINLQNATDAAAFAGAAVQARQLTNIAYMNWEMRNVYKEWMFKYYVIGGLNLPSIAESGIDPSPSASDQNFLMQTYARGGSNGAASDQYNFPSVCVDFANTGGSGICTNYLVPGLPRFESSNVLGMDETTNAFIDTIVSEKSKDCSERTRINFFTANTWAYNVRTDDTSVDNISNLAPELAANFMGAFPKAFEIGLRIRNLEAQVNFAPIDGICIEPSNGVNCTTSMNNISGFPSQERPFKAFQSAWRNLGSNGGSGGQGDLQFKNSFTLREIPPKLDSIVKQANSLSNLLIPPGATNALNKYYLDLKLMTINYATFYSAFTPSQGQIGVEGNSIDSEGQCDVTKIGLPVPGYPLGFAKNPDFLTYYAVEGRAKFIGLFNPFVGDGVILTAHAAAKPFGGRIGPQIFDISDSRVVRPRSLRRSSGYISALDTGSFRGTFGGGGAGLYAPGMPLPLNSGSGADKFWLTDDGDNVGGWLDGNAIFYGVPNLVYDYPNSGAIQNNSSYLYRDNVQILGNQSVTATASPNAGLYNKEMFNKFKTKLKNYNTVVSSQDISEAIFMIKSPTLYEAHNYLIPTPEEVNQEIGTDSFGVITGDQSGAPLVDATGEAYRLYQMDLYAPLVSNRDPNSLYKEVSEISATLNDYLLNQEAAIEKYKNSMNIAAADIFSNNVSRATGQNTGAAAARAISDLPIFVGATAQEIRTTGVAAIKAAKPSCASIAGKFIYFYTGNANTISGVTPDCPTPLPELMQSRWNTTLADSEIYSTEFTFPANISDAQKEQYFSAYRPGPDHDAGQIDGVQKSSLGGSTDKMIRNFYSTKFITLKSVTNTSNAEFNADNMLIYSEGGSKSASQEAKRSEFRNPIDPGFLSIDLNKIEH